MTALANIHSLTGAYVLDALPLDERASFEEHLGQCPDCIREMRELQSITTKLAMAAAMTPAASMREQVLTRVKDTRHP